MPTPSCLRRIVVGVDGSPGADAALVWSRREVGDDGELHVVHVVVADEPVPEHGDDVLVVRAPTVATGIAHLAEQAMAPYLHHALTHAPCPVALIPASWIA